MAITDMLGRKNRSVNTEPTPVSHEKESVNQSNFKSRTIKLELAELVEEYLNEENIPFKIEKTDSSAMLFIDPRDREIVDEILYECEQEYLEQKQYENSESKTKEGLDEQVSGATEKINAKTQEPKLYCIEIYPDFESDLDNLIKEKNVGKYYFDTSNGKRFVYFYGEDAGEIILKTYHDLVNQIANLRTPEPKKTESKKSSSNKSTKKVLGRTVQVMTRFTPDEMKKVQERIDLSGKRQGDFIREMLMDGYVKAFPTHANDLTIIQELQTMNAQLGKLTGAMVKIMQLEKENSSLSEEEKANLQKAINGVKSLRTEIKKGVKELWH